MSAVAVPLSRLRATSRFALLKRGLAIIGGAVIFGALAGSMASNGNAADVVALVAVFLPVALWKRPQLGPVVIMMSGLLIEQFGLNLEHNGVIAQQVPITNSIPLFQGLGSFHVEPADLLLMSILVVYMIRSEGTGVRWWPRTQVSLAVSGLVFAVIFGLVMGLMHHGDMRESFQECRPFIYFAAAYLITAVTIRTRSAVQAMLWGLVVAETIKSIQGIDVWSITKDWSGQQNVLGHEEAMFFSIFFFMVGALYLFGIRGRLRTVSTWLVPLVFFTDLVNDRRTAWLIMGAGFAVMLVIGYNALPHRRRTILKVAGVTVLAAAVYFPAFWNNTGPAGKVADAFRSEFGQPTARDALSDDYRIEENANLELNIQDAGILGEGFGIQINYALPMPGLLGVEQGDPGILYIPHDGVLYVLMRMGLLGGLALFSVIGCGIVAGCRLAKSREPQLAMIGALSAAVLVGWALEGATDQGFTLYRVAFVVGCVVGLAEAARHIAVAVPFAPSRVAQPSSVETSLST